MVLGLVRQLGDDVKDRIDIRQRKKKKNTKGGGFGTCSHNTPVMRETLWFLQQRRPVVVVVVVVGTTKSSGPFLLFFFFFFFFFFFLDSVSFFVLPGSRSTLRSGCHCGWGFWEKDPERASAWDATRASLVIRSRFKVAGSFRSWFRQARAQVGIVTPLHLSFLHFFCGIRFRVIGGNSVVVLLDEKRSSRSLQRQSSKVTPLRIF